MKVREQPRSLGFSPGFIVRDRRLMLQSQSDRIQSSIQAILPERVDGERVICSGGGRHGLSTEIHRQPIARRRQDILHQGLNLFSLENDRKDAVLKTVVVENVCETRCDNATEALIEQGPGCMFARGAATEVVTSQKNRGTLIARLVQKERWIGRAVLLFPPIKEEAFAKPRPLDGFQKLLRDDLIRIDVDAIQCGDETGYLSEGVHANPR